MGQSGQFKLWSTEVFASHALAGQSLGLHPLKPRQERYWKVYFMSYELGVLDVKERLIWAPAEWGKRAAVRSSPAGGEA